MPTRPGLALLLAAAGLARAADPTPGPAPSIADQLAAKLPPDVAEAALKWTSEDAKGLRALLILSPAELERQVLQDLAGEPAAASYVLRKLATEPPATDLLVLHMMGVDAFWATVPGVDEALTDLADATPDPSLMLLALDTERRIEAKRLRKILAHRIAEARAARDPKTLAQLAAADERWLEVERGAALPAYMRRPPPPFVVKPGAAAIRVVGFGDFGAGSEGQRAVAAEIVKVGAARPFDFGLTFGDNFYPSGMRGLDDPRWQDWWEKLYGPLHVVFYPTMGNHEYYSDDGAAAELAYRSPTWFFPAPYYTFTAGPVQFFAVDTTELSEAQVLWLDRAIGASTARWKVVYGHHPIFAPERNARSGNYMAYMQGRLWPLLRNRVDAYLCGHQHAMAHMAPQDGVHFFMSGGGGAELNRVSARAPGTEFAESTFGFLTLEADAARLKIAIFDTDGKPFDSEVVTK